MVRQNYNNERGEYDVAFLTKPFAAKIETSGTHLSLPL